jgi:tRNA nucleotidyltransferase (CCA-adding enzyme)
MPFNPDSLTPDRLNDFRHAAEQAWADDTRHENFIGHPQPSAGNCYVTSAWLKSHLGGHVGAKRGHYFWVSPGKSHVVDLSGDLFAHEPEQSAPLMDSEDEPWELDPHQKTHRPGPVMYKRADHPIYKGFRVLPDFDEHPRAKLFKRRADAALRGERVASYHQADLMGSDPYPGSTPQFQEDHKDINSITLHDEPDYNPDSDLTSHEYRFVVANGQLHVSPIHSHEDLSGHAGHNPDSNGPFAAGYAEVNRGHVLWSISSNIALQGLAKILHDYSDTVGWKFDGMQGHDGGHLSDDFGPKKSMYYRAREDGHLVMSEKPLPHAQKISIVGSTAYVREHLEALDDWARDFGYKLAEYPQKLAEYPDWGSEWSQGMRRQPHLYHVSPRSNRESILSDGLQARSPEYAPNAVNTRGVYLESDPQNAMHYWNGYHGDGDYDLWRVPQDQYSDTLSYDPHGEALYAPHDVKAELMQRTAEYPGGGDMTDKIKVRENLDTFDRGDPNWQPESDNPDAQLEGTLRCGECGQKFDREPALREHYRNDHEAWQDTVEDGHFPKVQDFDEPLGFGTQPNANGGETIAHTVVMTIPIEQARRHPRFATYAGLFGYDDEVDNQFYGAYRHGQLVAYGAVRVAEEPELLMIDALEHRSGLDSAILSLIQRQFPSLYTHTDSEGGERLIRRHGFVNVSKQRWRYSKGDVPKDMIEDDIPFIFDIDKGKIHLGYAGQKTQDIPGHFTPGGIVEGYYQPGGKMILISETRKPWTLYNLASVWYHQFPQMEITSAERLKTDGSTHKLASVDVGGYLKTLVGMDQAAHNAHNALTQAGGKVYVVGGAVRDALQGRDPKDLDLMVAGLEPEKVAHALGSLPGEVIHTGKRFGVYRYRTHGQEVEVALPRQDKYESGRRGEGQITVDPHLPVEKDLERRDFTANSMAVDLSNGQLIDPYGGAQDIENHILRTTHPDAFEEDPTRLVRALVAHGRFGLNPDERTRDEMESNAHMLSRESPDALNKVLDKLFASSNPAAAIRLGQDTGVLQHLFPEVSTTWDWDQNNKKWHKYTLGEHGNRVLDNMSRLSSDPDMRLAALMHDVGKRAAAWEDPITGRNHFHEQHVLDADGKPTGQILGGDHALIGSKMAEARMRALNYPSARINRVAHLIKHHEIPDFSTQQAARKLRQRVGDDHVDDVLKLRLADKQGQGVQSPESAQQQYEQQQQLVDESRKEQAPTDLSNLNINGNDLIGMGLKPGPAVGSVLRQLLDDVVREPTLNERGALMQRAQTYVNAQPAT